MNVLPFEVRLRVASALVEGNSIRSTERMVGIHRDSVMRFGVLLGDGCAALHDRLVRDVHASLIEIDEIWTYVGKKQKQLKESDPAEYGDQYVFVALDANAKLAISYLVAKRTAAATQLFMRDVRARVLGRPQITTDGFSPYVDAIDQSFGIDVDYAMLVKDYVSESSKHQEASRRYSPGRIIASAKMRVVGAPNENLISTSYVERQNLTMRMHMRRFTRLTNGFSKKLRNLGTATSLHFAFYNFCRIHESLRVTPAMAAGITDHVWSLAELVERALAAPETPIATPPPPQVAPPQRPALRLIRGGAA